MGNINRRIDGLFDLLGDVQSRWNSTRFIGGTLLQFVDTLPFALDWTAGGNAVAITGGAGTYAAAGVSFDSGTIASLKFEWASTTGTLVSAIPGKLTFPDPDYALVLTTPLLFSGSIYGLRSAGVGPPPNRLIRSTQFPGSGSVEFPALSRSEPWSLIAQVTASGGAQSIAAKVTYGR